MLNQYSNCGDDGEKDLLNLTLYHAYQMHKCSGFDFQCTLVGFRVLLRVDISYNYS